MTELIGVAWHKLTGRQTYQVDGEEVRILLSVFSYYYIYYLMNILVLNIYIIIIVVILFPAGFRLP